MSSDGSVSSRISQFGLYRSIDARTEEFLKLSKKRQIRQGCVCAAISTALTVTVVVKSLERLLHDVEAATRPLQAGSASDEGLGALQAKAIPQGSGLTTLLIYEYNIIAEAKRNYKTNWLDLMNNSADDPNLLERLSKEKIEIDRSTLKLLPVLLKALARNKYVEKILEEPTSLYPAYEHDGTTETTLTKNVFADTRNWMKTPQSRLYTIEYKTSPIVYFKNPTRNTEYFTKIRKIRDYQRMLNYVDKMISEKNYLGTTLPMKKDYYYTEKPYKMTTPLKKAKLIQKMVKKQNQIPKTSTLEKSSNCKCSNKLSDIMNKLLNSIEQLLAYFKVSYSKEKVGCKINTQNNNSIQRKPIESNKTLNHKSIIVTKKKDKMSTENKNFYEQQSTGIPSYKKFLNRHKYTVDFTPTKSFDIRKDHTINTIMNLIRPNFKKHNKVNIDFNSNEVFSTTDSYMKSLDTNNVLKDSNSKLNTQYETRKTTPATVVSTVAEYILQKETYDVTPNIMSSHSTFSESDFNDDDYSETPETTTNSANNFNNFDTFILELVKSNLVTQNKNDSSGHSRYPFKGVRTSQTSYDNMASMRKMGNLVSENKNNSILMSKFHRFAPISRQISKPVTDKSTSTASFVTNAMYSVDLTEETTKMKHRNKTENSNKMNTEFKLNNINNIPNKEDTANISKENSSNDTTLQHLEEAIMILKNETLQNHNTVSDDTYQWKLVKLEENTSIKSMLPLSRPTYLEMQRNDWKLDENHDFDTDMNNYFFDQ